MRAPRIPDRNPIGDIFEGVVLGVGDYAVLAHAPIADYAILHHGKMIIRYGITFLGKPQYSIVPAILALDYGEFKTGEDAWEFIFKSSNLYPRADIVGYKNDGSDEMAVLKALDLEFPLHVLVYADDEANKPLARVRAFIGDSVENSIPRILQHLPQYPTIEQWLEA